MQFRIEWQPSEVQYFTNLTCRMVSYFGSLLGKSSSPHNTSIHICLFRITESCQWTFSVPSQNSWCPKNSKNSRLKVSLFPKTPIFSTWCTGIQLLFMATLPSKVGPLWRWFGNPGFLAHVTCVSPEIQLVLKCNQISFWMVVSNIVFFFHPYLGFKYFLKVCSVFMDCSPTCQEQNQLGQYSQYTHIRIYIYI